jgi:uncharacterized protein YcbX
MAITVTALHTTPIKALRIRAVDSIELGPTGALGDRAFYLIDEDGAMVNGKRLGALQTVTAEYDPAASELALCFADGERAEASVQLGPMLDTTFFGMERRARVLDGPWADALSRPAAGRGRIRGRSRLAGGDLARVPRLARAAQPSRGP